MQSEYLGEWRFDTGPSLLLFPDKYEEAFEALGSPLDTSLQLQRVAPAAYRVFFPDTPSFRLDLLNDESAMATQLEALEPGAGEGYRRFLAMARSHLELGVPYFIDRDFTELQDAKGLLDLLPKAPFLNPWHLLGPHDLVMRSFFKDARLRAAFTFQDLYVGLNPKSAPAVFSLLAGTELTAGVFYPMGGFGAVRDALCTAAQRCGVTIRTRSPVESINVGRDGAVAGVTLHTGEQLPADVVVCNVDLPAAYSLLHSTDTSQENGGHVAQHAAQRAERLGGMKYSAGVIAFNWAISSNIDALSHHNVFLSGDFKRAWRPATTPGDYAQHPNFYVHCPSKTDASAAPPGCDSVMVLLPVGNFQDRARNGVVDPENYHDMIQVGRERVLQTFRDTPGIGDLSSRIVEELVIAPPDWAQRYGLRHGAAFGLSHGLDQLSVFRPGLKDDEVQGLYFVGASTRPGNGVPLCMISAKLAAERVLQDLKPTTPT